MLPTDFLVESTHPDFPQTGLKTSSVIKLDKLVTIDRSVPLGELGQMSDALMRQVDGNLRYALEL